MKIYKDKYGVPYLTHDDIEAIGEYAIEQYKPVLLKEPQPTDIEDFLENFLHLNIDYKFLSHNGSILGMMVFENTDKVPIFDPDTQRAEYLEVSKDTVIIDARLLDDEHSLRFTGSHEGSHKILHQTVYMKPAIQCRKMKKWDGELWPMERTVEFQANSLGAVLLMPKKAVEILMGRVSNNIAVQILSMRDTFNVSISAAFYRLKDLGYIDKTINIDTAKTIINNYQWQKLFKRI